MNTLRQNFTWTKLLSALLLACVLTAAAAASELHAPATVEAGHGFSIPLDGSGQATLYLIGPDHVVKRSVNLGGNLQIEDSDVRSAGRYQMILCDGSCTSAIFEVRAASPAHLSFFLHPSRVPVSTPNSIDATAFVFDRFFNLVLTPTPVDFRITPADGAGFSRQNSTRDGVTWLRMDSTPREGRVQVTAGLSGGAGSNAAGNVEEARVIQQVAAEACGLRMKVEQKGNTVTLETDPVRDCSGNALPDGTIVSFIKVDQAGRSTVDTPIKKGIARTQFSVTGPARISIACGVVLGNEVAIGGKS